MLSSLRAQIRELRDVAPPVYWVVWWGTLINRLGTFVIVMLTIYLTRERGLDVGEAGSIVALFGLGQVAASLAGGQLADRWGRRATLLLSLFGGAGALLVLGQMRALESIAIMVAVVGFIGELYRPAVAAIVADVIPESHRVRAYSLLHWVVNVGFAVAAVIGGALAEVDFAVLFVLDAATLAAYGVLVIVAVPETRPLVRATHVAESSAMAPASWILDRELVVFVAITLLLTTVAVQTGPALSAHMVWQGFSTTAYGVIIGLNGALIIFLQPALTRWAMQREAERVLLAGAVLTTLGVALHGVGDGLAIHVVAVVLWTLGEIFESPMRSSIVASLAPADARGRYQGAMVTSWGLALFLGHNVGPRIWEDVSPSALWLSCVALGGLGCVGLIWSARARRRRIDGVRPSE